MSDLRAKVGQPVTADKWNRVVDRLEKSVSGHSAGGFGMSRVEVMIKNDSGANREFGELLVIDSFDGLVSADMFQVSKNVIYSCITPVWHTAIDKIVVLAEPIPDGEYGRAVISGHCIARTTAVTAVDTYVMVHPEYPNRFKGGTSGQAKMIAKLTLADYALVNLGEKQPLWRYALQEASNAPDATEVEIRPLGSGVGWGIADLSDGISLTLDQPVDYQGLCMCIGNEFHAIHPERYVHPDP